MADKTKPETEIWASIGITKNLGKSLITNGTNKSNTIGKYRTNDNISMYSSIPSTTKQSIYNNNVETAQLFLMNNVPAT